MVSRDYGLVMFLYIELSISWVFSISGYLVNELVDRLLDGRMGSR